MAVSAFTQNRHSGQVFGQLKCSIRAGFKRFDSDNGVRIKRPIYVGVMLAISRVLVPDGGDHAIRIDNEQH